MNPIAKTSQNQKIIVAVIVIILLLGGFFLLKNKSGNQKTQSETTDDALPNTEVLPTVDSSVIVDLKADRLKREVTLTIDGVPTGTDTIDYELSYLADGDLPKGVIGTIEVKGKKSIEKSGITLGTCSSGACVYDKGVKSIKVSLKFNSDSGAKIFEKEFDI